jgi:BirA family biotin operon repressor/biotin-[acetyl-CoA-carboxylase] ligase
MQVGGLKLAGVLLEMVAESESVEWVIAGVGINVIRPDSAPAGATYISDLLQQVSAAQVAAVALDGMAEAYTQWQRDGFAPLRAEYIDRFVLMGDSVVVRDLTGSVRASGVVRGVDVDGRLLVESEAGTEAVASGEVTLRG